jgi:hypothetical protein
VRLRPHRDIDDRLLTCAAPPEAAPARSDTQWALGVASVVGPVHNALVELAKKAASRTK